MALLDSAAKDSLAEEIQSEFSNRWEEIPLSRQAVRSGIDTFDAELETCEAAIIGGLPAGAASWLTSKPAVARSLLIAVAEKRKEVL